jgi:hypothetical protein
MRNDDNADDNADATAFPDAASARRSLHYSRWLTEDLIYTLNGGKIASSSLCSRMSKLSFLIATVNCLLFLVLMKQRKIQSVKTSDMFMQVHMSIIHSDTLMSMKNDNVTVSIQFMKFFKQVYKITWKFIPPNFVGPDMK